MTKFFCQPVVADLSDVHSMTLAYLTVPAGQMWRTQYYAIERVGGTADIKLTSSLTPANGPPGVEFLVNTFHVVGETFTRVVGGGVFGPGDKVKIAGEAGGPVSIKMIIAIAIDESVTVHVPPPPGPILSYITPDSVARNSKPTFTLSGAGFTLIQSAIEVQIRRPNAVIQSRPGVFVNDGVITFAYDNITLAGVYDVLVKGGAYTSNMVPFTAVEA